MFSGGLNQVKLISRLSFIAFISASQYIKQLIPKNSVLLRMASSSTSGLGLSLYDNLSCLQFDNRNVKQLPLDSSKIPGSRQVPDCIFSLVDQYPIVNPDVIAVSSLAMKDLLGISDIEAIPRQEVANYLGGNKALNGSVPAAHCYCGHQFGSFAGQLGDGAAMYLGEAIHPQSGVRWELQLKGSGLTPYSRSADGRKVLRSSVREFLCSEAMHHLGVPTTRAGSCVTSSSTVQRDPMYDGGVIDEKCTVVSRIAPNFFRFGSFEIFKPADRSESDGRAGPSAGNAALKEQLLRHILSYYPSIERLGGTDLTKATEVLFAEVSSRTAELVARWQAVGFVHGVLNTDNMSLMGVTIDYGPYGFMEHFDPFYVPNGSDSGGRYAYQEQPAICRWNLGKLAEVLVPHLKPEAAEATLKNYDIIYQSCYDQLISAKFGFGTREVVQGESSGTADSYIYTRNVQTAYRGLSTSIRGHKSGDDQENASVSQTYSGFDPTDAKLQKDFWDVMTETRTDFTDAFVALTEFVEELSRINAGNPEDTNFATCTEVRDAITLLINRLVSRCATPEQIVKGLRRKMRVHRLQMHPQQIEQLSALLRNAPPEQLSRMFAGAPVDIIRGEVEGEKKKLDLLVAASEDIRNYEHMGTADLQSTNREKWTSWCEAYASRMARDPAALSTAAQGMRKENPTFVLRNWLAQDAIQRAESKRDYSGVQILLYMLEDPFNPAYSTFRQRDACGAAPAAASYSSSHPDPQWATKHKLPRDVSEERARELIEKYTGTAPEWAEGLICTCSS